MNYKLIYNSLIERAKTRSLDGYKESHHIVPKCLGGSDDKDNLVDLTPEEHYLAHLLLVQIYPNDHKLSYAAIKMTMSTKHTSRPNNKRYGWLKREHFRRYSLNETGKKYYNNGVDNIKLKPGEPVPEGFILGRSYSPTTGVKHGRKNGFFKNSEIQKANANKRWSKDDERIAELFGVANIKEVHNIVVEFRANYDRYWIKPFMEKYPFIKRAKARSLLLREF